MDPLRKTITTQKEKEDSTGNPSILISLKADCDINARSMSGRIAAIWIVVTTIVRLQ
jgi:hypothetical protein